MDQKSKGGDHIFEPLEVALLSRNWDCSISVAGSSPRWFNQQFSDILDPTSQVLNLPEYSALESFFNGSFIENQTIRFEESLPNGKLLSGIITACGEGIFALRPLNNEVNEESQKIRKIRETALQNTNFGIVKSRRQSATVDSCNIDQTLTSSFLPVAVSSVRDPLIILDAEGKLIIANSPARKLFPNLGDSASSNSAVWEEMETITISKNRLSTITEQLKQGIEEPLQSTLELPLPIRQTWETQVCPVTSQEGLFLGSIWSLRKQEDTKAFLEQISQSERLEVVGRLAGGVAHDFNNLLAIVMGNLSLLSEAANENGIENIKESSELAMEAAEKAAGLVRQLLGFSKKSRLDREVTDLDTIVNDTATLFSSAANSGIALNLDLRTEQWKVNGDAEKLGQVFLNLFENASQVMQGEGEINVTARTFILDDPDMAGAMECEQGHYLVINITDDGPGMPKEIREKVFEPFFTTKDVGKGTGLGLANAMGIVQQHGGHISCTSIPGEGTAFTIYIPRERELSRRKHSLLNAVSREKNLDRIAKESNEPAILVVDDEEMLRNVVRTMLHKHKFRTIAAFNGKNALDIIEERQNEIAAIVLDLAMPEMSGNELFKELNKRRIEIPVIVTSGYLVDSEKFVRDAGGEPAGFLSKPYQLEDLLHKVRDQYSPTDVLKNDDIALPG